MVVLKFGGSSVRDSRGIERCVEVALQHQDVRLIVISATFNTTNELEMLFGHIINNDFEKYTSLAEQIYFKHFQMLRELNGPEELEVYFSELKDEMLELFNLKKRDQLLSIGERFSSSLFNFTYNTKSQKKSLLIDARNFIVTDEYFGEANVDFLASAKNCLDLISTPTQTLITQGFIAKSLSGETTVLGREGSDYSATIFANLLGANKVYIYTDVEGISNIRPDLSKKHKKIPHLNFEIATILAKAGAKVLFHRTLDPIKLKNIPLVVASTFNPSGDHTIIDGRDQVDPFVSFTIDKKDSASHWIHIFSPDERKMKYIVLELEKSMKLNVEDGRNWTQNENLADLIDQFERLQNEL